MKTHRPWGAYALRLFTSALLFVTGYALVAGSTFALRMRNDAPVGTIVVVICAALAVLPLLFGRRYLTGAAISAFLLTGIGGYWWTTIAWDEFIKKSGFPTNAPPTFSDHLLVASPAVVIAFYAIVSRASMLKADLKDRGAEPDEASRAACASFLSGSALLVLCGALSIGLWALMASGLVFRITAPVTGVPALVLAAMFVVVSYALIARRLPRFRFRRAARPDPRPAAAPARPVLKPIAAAKAPRGKRQKARGT